jgi:uncharacterized repeat protein (TIGR04138 family)
MHEATFEEVIERIRVRDPRYARDAYLFVREALDHTQNAIIKLAKDARAAQPPRETDEAKEPPVRHVTGQELLAGIRDYALAQFGPMVPTVFEEWGIHRCADFGEIVFNMVEIGLLAKTERDSREDFKNGYDFDEAFRQPFLPASKAHLTKPVEGVTE